MLEDAVEEMNRRLQAPPGTEFPLLLVTVDEAQVAFMCPVKDEEKRPYGGSSSTSRTSWRPGRSTTRAAQ